MYHDKKRVSFGINKNIVVSYENSDLSVNWQVIFIFGIGPTY